MSRPLKKPFHIRFTFHLRVWHRRLGITAAIFILLLSSSGLLLNHSDDLNLAKLEVNSDLLLSLYHIKEPITVVSFSLGSHVLVATDDRIWLDRGLIRKDSRSLNAALIFNNMIVASVGDNLLLLTENGATIDELSPALGIPQGITGLATRVGNLYVRAEQGIYQSDAQLMRWQVVSNTNTLTWKKPHPQSSLELKQINQLYRSSLLNWERVLLDFHSGRIFGLLGPWGTDLIAILLILLSCSGIYMWLRRAKPLKK